MTLGIKPIIDFVFKKVFGSPENVTVLIGLLNAILKLARPIVHVEILNPFSYQEFADAKQVVLDVRARDSDGRWLNIEMQVAVFSGLLQRLVYYACSMFVEQIGKGEDYSELDPAISICLLPNNLFQDEQAPNVPHHRFRLADPEHGREIPGGIEVHTVELSKYNLSEGTISEASEIEQWAFFLLNAENYEPDRLRELLPSVQFQQAISVIETIAAKTEDRLMYDQRQKALRDYEWSIASARKEAQKEGRDEGRQEGRDEGVLAGRIQTFQEMLGEEADSTDSLVLIPKEELSARLAALQERFRTRGEG